MKAINLRVDLLYNPLGLCNKKPMFYWMCDKGIIQSAYQIICMRRGETIWDSGKVISANTTHIQYQGAELNSRDVVDYKVQLWDENDIAGEMSFGSFEMGLLRQEDFEAKWITGDYNPKKNIRYPVDYFKKTVNVKSIVKKARIYASALGVYDIFIDGKRLEDFILAPGITDYRKRVQYQTYDVTAYFDKTKEYDIEIRLADGWYRGSSAAYGVTNVYGSVTALFAQIELTHEDGHVTKIHTGSDWLWSNDGALRFADLKDGEKYDSNMAPAYTGRAKLFKQKTPVNLVGSDNVYVTEHEHFKAKLIKEEGNIRVYDFDQNVAGYIKFRIKGPKGSTVRFFASEILDKNGFADISPMQETRPERGWNTVRLLRKLITNDVKGRINPTPRQEIIFTCSGEWDSYKTSFAVFGFRYIQAECADEFELESFESIAIYSDMEEVGSFSCSNEKVNKFVDNTRWSMKSNFLDIPTDCPTRERLGWTGDAQVFFNAGAYFMDTSAFFRKWLKDMSDAQYDDGLIPAVIPYEGVEMMYKSTGSSVGWADTIYLIPYRYYKLYGDEEILRQYWNMMKKYGDYLLSHRGFKDKKKAKEDPYSASIYEKGVHLGEWLEPVEFRDKVYGARALHTEECTAYLYYAMTTLSEIAGLLGKIHEKELYKEAAVKARDAYTTLFMDDESIQTNRQAKLVRPIALGLLDDNKVLLAKAQDLLEKAVENFEYRVGTGFLSTPFLLKVLSDAGKTDTAYKVLLNEKNPGWIYEILKDATTVWENWEGLDEKGKGSFNHYSPGAACEWLFDTVAGIKVSGHRSFVISPLPGKELEYANGSYKSIYGEVKSRWEKKDGRIIYYISVPSNCNAVIKLKGKDDVEVTAGEYQYEI